MILEKCKNNNTTSLCSCPGFLMGLSFFQHLFWVCRCLRPPHTYFCVRSPWAGRSLWHPRSNCCSLVSLTLCSLQLFPQRLILRCQKKKGQVYIVRFCSWSPWLSESLCVQTDIYEELGENNCDPLASRPLWGKSVTPPQSGSPLNTEGMWLRGLDSCLSGVFLFDQMARSLKADLFYSSLSLQCLTMYPAHSRHTVFDVVQNEQSLNTKGLQ